MKYLVISEEHFTSLTGFLNSIDATKLDKNTTLPNIKKNYLKYDVVILDFGLKAFDPYDFAKEMFVKEQKPKLVAINSGPEDRKEDWEFLRRCGMKAILEVPYNRGMVIEALRVLEKYLKSK